MFVHVCGTRAASREDGALAKWPMNHLTYFEDLAWPRLSREQVAWAFDTAAAHWVAVAGVVLTRVNTVEEAHIVARNGAIDGRGGILALSDLPYGASEQTIARQTFDSAEDWGPETLGMLQACICHELGHALGLEHIAGVGALLDPFIVPGREAPQQPDIEAMQSRYGANFIAAPNPEPMAPAEVSALEQAGANYAPFVVGCVADAFVKAASGVEAGHMLAIDYEAIVDSLNQSLAVVLFPQIDPANVAGSLREMAKGLAYSTRKQGF